jgi:hypothetical protein
VSVYRVSFQLLSALDALAQSFVQLAYQEGGAFFDSSILREATLP